MPIDEKLKEMIKGTAIEDVISCEAEIDTEKYRKFLLHECPYNLQKIGDEHLTYRFTKTRLRTTLEVECACGKKEDITDYSVW